MTGFREEPRGPERGKRKRGKGGRKQAERLGRRAEWAAALWLILKGYRILAHRARTPYGEIDLIAVRNRVVCFVEVKARADLATALSAPGPRQLRRIAAAASHWMGAHAFGRVARARDPGPGASRNNARGLGWRYDVIAIPRKGRWVHKRDAFRPGAEWEN